MEYINPTTVHPSSIVFSETIDLATRARILVSRGESSMERREMLQAQAYFQGRNEAIDKKARVYRDAEGKKFDNPSASNVKIRSNFARMLVQQKQDYALGKTFVLRVSSESEGEANADDDDYARTWKDFCKRELFAFSYDLVGNAVKCGIGWAYVYIDGGELKLSAPDPALVYPVWREKEHNTLEAVAYERSVAEYSSMSPTVVRYCDYWDGENRATFNVSEGYRETTESRAQILGGEGAELSWGKPPLVALKGNTDERTMLSFVRDYIDAYDLLSSNSVDSLVDALDPLLIIKGVSPSVYDLVEARELAKVTRLMSLDGDGDAHYIQATTDTAAHSQKLEELRRDIIRFGYGVDYEDARFGGNPNQMVVRSLYQNLDTYTDGLERQFRSFIKNLKYFFDRWYVLTGRGSEEECAAHDVDAQFDRSMMINESSVLEDAIKLSGTGVSRRTILENIPQVEDVDLELERVSEEQRESEDRAFAVGEQLGVIEDEA